MTERSKGFTVWFNGLASAGKSTLANLLKDRLSQQGYSAILMEPDEVRQRLMPDLTYSMEDKTEAVRRFGYIARLIIEGGGVVLIPWIAPLRSVLDEARREVGRFVEVYVDCPIDVCKERDVRGLYIMAERGQVKSLPGVGDPFEMPESAEITVHTGQESPEQCVAAIVRGLEGLGYVQGSASQ